MSTMTYTTTTRRIARAEWTKLRTLPSTWRTAVLTMVMAIGFGVAVAFSADEPVAHHDGPAAPGVRSGQRLDGPGS